MVLNVQAIPITSTVTETDTQFQPIQTSSTPPILPERTRPLAGNLVALRRSRGRFLIYIHSLSGDTPAPPLLQQIRGTSGNRPTATTVTGNLFPSPAMPPYRNRGPAEKGWSGWGGLAGWQFIKAQTGQKKIKKAGGG